MHRKNEETPIDPSQAPPQDANANSDPIPSLLGWLANRIAAITGKTSWWQSPRTTLEAAGGHIETTSGNPHGTTAAQVGALRSVDGVRNDGGDVDFVAEQGGAINVIPDDAANTVTFGVDVADTTQPGVAEIATDAETDDGLDGSRIVPPSSLRKRLEKNPYKLSVRVATTANVTLSGTQTIDDVALAVGDRVLVKNQTNGAEHGIWVVQSGAWIRASDADAGPKLPPRTFVVVQQGTAYAGTIWTLSTTGTITIGTTVLAFQQLSGGGGGGGAVDASGSQKGVSRLSVNPQVSTDPMSLGPNDPIFATRIDGLTLRRDGAAALSVLPGSAWIPSENRVVNVPNTISKTGLALTANTMYHVYLFLNAGVPDIEVVTTAPSAPYKGSARIKGGATPDNSRRYLGSIRGSATANVMLNFRHDGYHYRYMEDATVAPLELVAAAAGTAEQTVSAAGLVPPTTQKAHARFKSGGAGAAIRASAGGPDMQVIVSGVATEITLELDASQNFYWNNTSTGGSADVAILGYYEAR